MPRLLVQFHDRQPLFLQLPGVGVVGQVAVARGWRIGFALHGPLGLGCQLVDLLGTQHAPLFEDLLLIVGQGIRDLRIVPGVGLVIAREELGDLLRDSHAAPVVSAHGTEIGVNVEVFIVQGTGGVGIERELEVLFPVQGRTCLGQLVISVTGAGDAQGDV